VPNFLLFCHKSRVCRTDRDTNGRTEGRTDSFLVASPHWHSMQSGMNENKLVSTGIDATICSEYDILLTRTKIRKSQTGDSLSVSGWRTGDLQFCRCMVHTYIILVSVKSSMRPFASVSTVTQLMGSRSIY